ncbi:MAG: DUF2085 domain-containing protein [Chloroflexi bacterium]|nr:DUF2085 domain-containing protein [Chloroflexota bacterium]
MRALDRFATFVQDHWLALSCTFLIAYAALPIGAAVLKSAGWERSAQLIYQPYKALCHTYGFRSFYLFGEKTVYSRDEFEQKTGLDTRTPRGLFAARDFQGNPQMGYKIALCQRDMAIYPAMALGGMLFAVLRRRMRPMPWWLFVTVGVLPIALDGFSQLFSQPPFSLFPPFQWIPLRESVWQLRVLTGSLFGFSAAWLVFPLIASTLPPPRET